MDLHSALYAGNVDLERGIEDIPVFSLFELNWGAV